jgi:alpha-L-fucosidase
LIQELVDVGARGGNLLLNVGPTSPGEIPWLQARLADIGWWLRRFGDAIYDTRPWQRPSGTTASGLDVRYTATDDAVHAIVLGTPKAAEVDLDVELDPDARARAWVAGTSLSRGGHRQWHGHQTARRSRRVTGDPAATLPDESRPRSLRRDGAMAPDGSLEDRELPEWYDDATFDALVSAEGPA